MPPEFRVRPYEKADGAGMRWLHARTPPAGKVSLRPQSWRAELDHIADHFEAFWVAVEQTEAEEAIVGMTGVARVGGSLTPPIPAGLVPPPPAGRIHAMRVAPERQRRGIGRLLLTNAIDWVRAEGYASLILDTTPQQEAAVALYRAAGFELKTESKFGDYDLVWFELKL